MKASEKQAIRNAEFVAAGICRFCRGKLDGASKTRCSVCVNKRAAQYDARLSAGICNMCSGKADRPGKKSCSGCAEKMNTDQNVRRREKFTQGKCTQCGEPRQSVAGKYCTTCLLKGMSRKIFNTSSGWVDLKALLDRQQCRCAYTNDPISVGDGGREGWRYARESASIDHVVPLSKGGTNDITNLQWVSWEANNAKRASSHDDFVAMCVKIAERHGPKSKTFAYRNADGLEDCVL